jgi:hypothetical protein
MFTRPLLWSLSWATLIQYIPSHPISLISILILSYFRYIYIYYLFYQIACMCVNVFRGASAPKVLCRLSMGPSQLWEASSRLATQDILLLIWKWKAYNHILNQINTIHILTL